jgi:hypothetical protein
MSVRQIRREASPHPLREIALIKNFKRQHVLIFEKLEH